MSEPRSIWCVTKDGVPIEGKWALVRTPAEGDLAALPPAVRASRPPQHRRPGGPPRSPLSRRLPLLARSGMGGAMKLVGRAIEVDGLRYHLHDRGRPHPGSRPDRPMEPLDPDAVVLDETALLAAAERLGQPLEITERGTLRRVRKGAGIS
jgi:hypothetical protein